jgi:hypothetical protein
MRLGVIPYQLITVLLGALIALPLKALSLPLLITLPGLCLYLIYKNYSAIDVTEGISFSITFSFITVPLVSCLLYITGIDIRFTGMALGILMVMLSALSYVTGSKTRDGKGHEDAPSRISRKGFLKQLAIIGISTLLALAVYVPLSNSYVISPIGLIVHPTHASDLNFHLSIISRFIESPHIPVEDPYLPNHYISYNWFMHVYLGTLTIITGIHQFTTFKIVFPLLFFALSMNIYLLGRKIFNYRTALLSTVVYTIGGGMAWALIAYFRPNNIFHYLIYQFDDTAFIKYDQTILFFLLPQTQSFALVILVFAIFLWIKTLDIFNLRNTVVLSLILIALSYYHLVTAFPLFISMGLYAIYTLIKRGKESSYPTLIPLTIASLVTIPYFLLISHDQPSQIAMTYVNYSVTFMLLTYGIMGILAFIGAYQSIKSERATPLIFFAITTFIIMNTISLPLTYDTYRFLVYLWIPIAIFASYYISQALLELQKRKLSSKRTVIKASVVAVALICALPTSFIMISYYSECSYLHIPNDELKAMEWIKSNTHKDSIFLEEPSTFTKIPLATGRRLAFAGYLYTTQYHGIDKYTQINLILNEGNPVNLSSALRALNVSYVFIGHDEQPYRISSTITNGYYFEKVYDEDMIRIYDVK